MAIDPNQLKAFANVPEESEAPAGPQPDEEGAGDMQENGEGRFGKLIPLLEEHAKEIEACCDELPQEALDDPEAEPEDDDKQTFMESLEMLPGDLLDEMKTALDGGIELEEATQLADHLSSEGQIDDPEAVAAWLYRAAQSIDEVGSGEGEEPEEEPDDEGGEYEEEPEDFGEG